MNCKRIIQIGVVFVNMANGTFRLSTWFAPKHSTHVHPHLPTLCIKYDAHSNYNFKRFIFDHKFMSDPSSYEISFKMYTTNQK